MTLRVYRSLRTAPKTADSIDTTSYVAVAGPGTAWRGPTPTRRRDFPSDPSKVVLVAEVANPGIRWSEPRDLPLSEMDSHIKRHVGQIDFEQSSSDRRQPGLHIYARVHMCCLRISPCDSSGNVSRGGSASVTMGSTREKTQAVIGASAPPPLQT